jgi:hypothetical protein
LPLDVRQLARDRLLVAGDWATVNWHRGGELTGTVEVAVSHSDSQAITLHYAVRAGAGRWEPLQERIPLTSTPCHCGGERVWFVCPSCGGRRAVLYGLGGRFRCRACHDLAYRSMRELAWDRAARRTDKLR